VFFFCVFALVYSQSSCPGVCQDNSLPCSGSYVANLCPGPDNIECCEGGGPNPEPNPNPEPSPDSGSYYGCDVSDYVSQSKASCMVNNGLSFGVVRAWHSTGHVDSNVVSTAANLWAGGFTSVDVYMFPCYKCGDGGGQVSTCVSYLQNNGVKFGTFWFDIEGPSYWSGDTSENADFFNAMKQQGTSMGLTMGVYTGWSQWPEIMGGLDSSDLPLWYPHYDGSPNFDDFQSFNNWGSPVWKQYSESGSTCGGDYDANWAPSAPSAMVAAFYNKTRTQAAKKAAQKTIRGKKA